MQPHIREVTAGLRICIILYVYYAHIVEDIIIAIVAAGDRVFNSHDYAVYGKNRCVT